MDKYEYKVRADEIKSLIAEGEYAQAVEIADMIDWRRVKSVMMLCMVSDLYKVNRRYEDAKNMLKLAYERKPGGRTICYSLCELCIKTEEFVQAVNYYNEFVKVAPKDSGRYILQYKLYEAQNVNLEERIGVLEELKKRDYREKWAYELAYLYHRVGLATRCVEECDELILWFGDGKYVVKAMELKMLHQPLTPSQQEVYDHRFDEYVPEEEPYPEDAEGQNYEQQEAYSDSGEELPPYEGYEQYEPEYAGEQEDASQLPEELDIQVKTMDVGKYNTINLQKELAAGLQEVLGTNVGSGENPVDGAPDEMEGTEVFFGETGEMGEAALEAVTARTEDSGNPIPAAEEQEESGDATSGLVMSQMREETRTAEDLAEVLSQETDGQIRMVLPEHEIVDRQITGQMKIEDILAEWERTKKENEEKCREEVRQHVLRQTGPMFTEFEAAVRDGILAGLDEAGGEKTADTGSAAAAAGEAAEPETGDLQNTQGSPDYIEEQPYPETEGAEDARACGEEYAYPEDGEEQGALNYEEEQFYPETEGEEDARAYGEEYAYPEDGEEQEVLNYEEEQFYPETEGDEDALVYQEEYAYPEDGEGQEVLNYEEEQFYPETEGDEEARAYGEEYAYPEDGEEQEVLNYEEEQFYPETEGEEDALVYQEEYAGQEEGGCEEWAENLEEESEVQPEDMDFPELTDGDALENLEETAEGEEPEEEQEAPRTEASDYLEALEQLEGSQDQEKETESVQDKKEAVKSAGGSKQYPLEREKARIRALTREEKELFAPFIQNRQSREQLVKAIDSISMAAYTGNVVITGEEGMDTMTLAKNMIREIRMTDSNFSGKVARITGQGMNKKNVREILEGLNNGALIIQKAAGMDSNTASMLHIALQQEKFGIIVIMEDTKKAIQKLFLGVPQLFGDFTARMDLEALSNDTLVSFGRRYAREKEYSIDDLGMLALHTRIEECQTIDHVVTVIEVKQIIDEAIRHASRKTLGHFLDVLLARRYDDEDMIILTEKDFVA